jgi:pyridoxal phosphate enzyme (YggS family)
LVTTIRDRIEAVREKIAESASRAGRDAADIKLLAVTKTRTVNEMLEALPFVDGVGENRVQEAASKKLLWPVSGNEKTEWRLIGHLQSNKIRKALTLFDSLDSIDSVATAEAIDRIASEENLTVPVLIEVNTSGETSKTGAAPEDFPQLLDRVMECPRLKLEGLMTIGPLTDDEAEVRSAFAMLRRMADEAKRRSGLPMAVLSMGMSDDFEAAVMEGSTMVRIGTSLFGLRVNAEKL